MTKKLYHKIEDFQLIIIFQVENGVSVSGGYGGATASVSVNIGNFDESEESESEFGEQEVTYTIGGDDLPEPIQLKLISIEETLDEKFWGNLDELKTKSGSPCESMNRIQLPELKSNIIRALNDYPKRMKAKRATGVWSLHYYTQVLQTIKKECIS